METLQKYRYIWSGRQKNIDIFIVFNKLSNYPKIVNMTTALDDRAPEDSTGAPEQMSSTTGMFPLGSVTEQPF